MNPRAAAPDTDKNTPKKTPFEQISEVEDREEVRVVEALNAYEAEARDAEKAIKTTERTEEEKLKEAAREELREFAKKEPAAILTESEKEAHDEAAMLEKIYTKQSEKLIQKLVASIADFSFLSSH